MSSGRLPFLVSIVPVELRKDGTPILRKQKLAAKEWESIKNLPSVTLRPPRLRVATFHLRSAGPLILDRRG